MKNISFLVLTMVMVSAYAVGGQTDYQVLFIGNSHSAANGLPNLVTTLIKSGLPDTTASSGLAPGYRFLDERLNDGETQALLESRSWTQVILQAQKYSSSGQFFYSTTAAETWIRRVKAQQAEPFLFPEWPRKGNKEEGQRVHNLHLGISSRESACVAPIGLAWEESIARYPALNLHAADGNHANLTGSLLTAFVIYEVMTTLPAASLPYVSSVDVNTDIQRNLREVASFVVSNNHATCSGIEATAGADAYSEPRIPTLNHWGLLLLAAAMILIGVRMR